MIFIWDTEIKDVRITSLTIGTLEHAPIYSNVKCAFPVFDWVQNWSLTRTYTCNGIGIHLVRREISNNEKEVQKQVYNTYTYWVKKKSLETMHPKNNEGQKGSLKESWSPSILAIQLKMKATELFKQNQTNSLLLSFSSIIFFNKYFLVISIILHNNTPLLAE